MGTMGSLHRSAALMQQLSRRCTCLQSCRQSWHNGGPGRHSLAQRRHFRPLQPVCMGRRSAKIAGRKGAQDSLKAKVWGKIAKQVLQAVKIGGASPESNPRLKEVLDRAKNLAVPRHVVNDNIKKATERDQADFTEVVYEGYGPAATGFVIECLTDNLNRSANAVRSAVQKSGGKMAEKGSVMFNFNRRGLIFVTDPTAEDKVFEAATDAGADDIQPAIVDDVQIGFKVLTAVEDFAVVRAELSNCNLPIDEDQSGLVYVPLAAKEVDDAACDGNELMMERLLAVDDVDAVYTNCACLA